MKKRVLVRGGAGFFGSHLHAIAGAGMPGALRRQFFHGTHCNIEPLLDDRAFEVMRHDITLARESD